MPQRMTDISSTSHPLQLPPQQHEDSEISLALASLRSRVLLRAGLRWFWISSVCFDLALLSAALYNPVWYENYSRAGMTAFMLFYPALVGLVRVVSMRLSVEDIARLADFRAGLSEQVSTAYEINVAHNLTAESLAFASLLSARAIAMLRRAEAKIIVPLQREAMCAGVAAAIAIGLCLWRSPELIGWALAGKQSASSSPLSSSLPMEERPVHIVGPQSASQPSPAPNGTPVAQQTHHYSPSDAPPTTPAQINHHYGDIQNKSDNNQSGHNTQNGQQQGEKTGSSGTSGQNQQGGQSNGQTSTANGAANSGQHSPLADQQGAGVHQGSSGASSTSQKAGQNSGASHGSGAGKSGNGNEGKQGQGDPKGGNGNNKSGAGQGSTSGPGHKPGSAASGQKQGQSNGGSGKSGAGQLGSQGNGQGQSSHGSSPQGGQGQNQSGHTAGQGSDTSSNSTGYGPGHSGMQHAESHDSKPHSVGSRVLPEMPHKTTMSFKIPGANKPDKSSPLQYGRSTTKQSPANNTNDGASYVAPSDAGSSVPVQAVEHDPTVPAGYRDLVKRYFSAAAKAARP